MGPHRDDTPYREMEIFALERNGYECLLPRRDKFRNRPKLILSSIRARRAITFIFVKYSFK